MVVNSKTKLEWKPGNARLFLRSSVTHPKPLRRRGRTSAAAHGPILMMPTLQGQLHSPHHIDFQDIKDCQKHPRTRQVANSIKVGGAEQKLEDDDYAPCASRTIMPFPEDKYPAGVRRSPRLQRLRESSATLRS
jgi:hypothetical protein